MLTGILRSGKYLILGVRAVSFTVLSQIHRQASAAERGGVLRTLKPGRGC